MKNCILKTINFIMGFIFIMCVSAIDSDYNTPFLIGIVISTAWGTLFAYANGYFDN